ncbi:MAG: hypothetical protein Q7R54_02225 [bacterium]|nr:hypothetical protein [bacterium]
MQKNLARFGFIIPLIAAGSFLVATSAFAAGPWYVDASVGASGDCLTPGTACKTIQEAVDMASAGDIINVAAGTYTEDLSVPSGTTSLDISGAVGATIVGVATVPSGLFPFAAPNINILGSGTHLHGFTIESPAYVVGNYSSGVIVGATDVELNDNTFLTNSVDNTDDISQALQTYADAAMPGVDVSGLNIHNNTFGALGSNPWGYEGIYINPDAATSAVTVSDNTFGGNILRAITSERSKTTVTGNTIVTDATPTDSGLSIPGSWQGINLRNSSGAAQSDIIVNHNIVGGSGSGLGFLMGISTGTAIQTLSGFAINKNSIAGNTTGIKNVSSSEVDGTCNWWGAANGPGPIASGSGSPVTSGVAFEPWLTSSDLTGPCNGTATITVTIDKYIDSAKATASSASSSSFPMASSWDAANIGAGSGTYALDTGNSYEAVTAEMTSGADYATNEVLSGAVVGASCSEGKPYALIGYSSGNTLAEAEAATPTASSPAFTDLPNDKVVIVWNETCPPAPMLKVHVLKYLDGATSTAVSASGYLFPMTATWSATNIGAGTGSYVLGTSFGGAADLYGADTSSMSAPADYTTSEITSDIDPLSEVLPVGAACIKDKYRLLGYKSSSVDFADAATMPLTTSAPVFVGLSSDRYVIVLDEKCTYTDEMNGQIRTFKEYTKDPSHHPRLAGWTIYLDMNDNNVLDGGDVASTTNAGGRAIFKGLAAGTYHVREEMQDGWNQLTPGAGADNEYSVTISAGEKSDWYRFTNYRPNSISGEKCDATEHPNPNGAKCKAGDPGLSGWTVELHKLTATTTPVTVGNLIATTVTDGSGMYNFGGLATGYYAIREVAQPGWVLLHVPTVVHLGSNENATKDLRNKSVPIEE